MITREIKANNLEDFYEQIRNIQEVRHGKEYTSVHEEIRRLLPECESYTEFGVMQGTTLAIPLLSKVSKVRGYDIQLTSNNAVRYDKGQHLFETYAKENDIDFQVIEADTATCEIIEQVDLLYIDSCHQAKHLIRELTQHSNNANKFIVFHDTTANPALASVIQNFVSNDEWSIHKVSTSSVGFMTIKRIT